MKTTLAIVLVAFAAILGCEGSNLKSPAGWSPFTVMDDEEAALAALWLSGDLTAPPQLYTTIRNDLAAIRSAFADSTTMTSVGFRPPWVQSMIILQLSDVGVQRLRDGKFTEFDELGIRFGLTSVDTSHIHWVNWNFIMLDFSGYKHPARLADSYGALDDVLSAERNGFVGDWSCVYPWRVDVGMSYLFRYAWGDCPSGCIHSIFWYFRVVDDEIELVGRYQRRVNEEPEWWDEARAAYNAHRGYPE